tara:strand:+ start:351 stop:611 length:261 start_codon:yes stop_codon:yes gene_type:complete
VDIYGTIEQTHNPLSNTLDIHRRQARGFDKNENEISFDTFVKEAPRPNKKCQPGLIDSFASTTFNLVGFCDGGSDRKKMRSITPVN